MVVAVAKEETAVARVGPAAQRVVAEAGDEAVAARVEEMEAAISEGGWAREEEVETAVAEVAAPGWADALAAVAVRPSSSP